MSRHMRCSEKILFDHFVGPYQELSGFEQKR